MSGNGYNPLRWTCERDGCFNSKRRFKIELFAEDLPGRLAFTDVDASAEVNGSFLFIEFKTGAPRDIGYGQKTYLERLTAISPKITAVIACGNAETNEITHYRWVSRGQFSAWQPCDLWSFKARIKTWSGRVSAKEAA